MVWWPINAYKSFFSWSWQSQFIDMDDGYVWNSGMSRPWSWFFVMWVSGRWWRYVQCRHVMCIILCALVLSMVWLWCISMPVAKTYVPFLIIDVIPGPHGPGISNHHLCCGAEHRFQVVMKHRFGRCSMGWSFNQVCLFSVLGQAILECLGQTGFPFQLMHWPQWSNDHDAC